MAVAVKFPPFVSASTWSTCISQLWETVLKRRGKYLAKYPGDFGPQLAPRLTNGDVVKLTMGALAGMGRKAFPLWYQYAAAAYGWDPKSDKLDASAKQRDAFYPDVLLVEFWKALMAVAGDLDNAREPNPRIDLDGEFSDVVFQGEVRSALRADGAEAAFKIPVPACKRTDGTIGPARCKRAMKRWPYLCEEWEQCSPILVDDPITRVKKQTESTLMLVALVALAFVVFDNKPRHRRN